MSIKKLVIYVVFLAISIGGGFVVEKYCHRFPTEEEMTNYHTSHFPTKLTKLESKQLEKKDGSHCVVFKGLHIAGGKEEVYFVEAGKRWVMPWQKYNWKTEKEDK